MPEHLYDIYKILSILILILSIMFLFRNFRSKNISFIKINMTINKITKLLSIFFFLLATYNGCGIYYHATTMAIKRSQAMNDLRKMAEKQREYYVNNGIYAISFKELGNGKDITLCPVEVTSEWGGAFKESPETNLCLSSSYLFYLNQDITRMIEIDERKLPAYINLDPYHIYAVYYLHNEAADILSIDYCGNIEIIESINVWPLPEPE